MISLVTMFKGLKHIGLDLSTGECYAVSIIIGLLCAIIGAFLIRRIDFDKEKNASYQFQNVELVFGVLMIFTACAMAFAHGSNDVANAVGPVAAIVSIVTNDGAIAQKSAMPIWILLLGGVGIVIGLLMYGHKVIATVGSSITDLTPSRGFCAELAASTTVVLASGTGIPISTTHTLVGAVLGRWFCARYLCLKLACDWFDIYVLDYYPARRRDTGDNLFLYFISHLWVKLSVFYCLIFLLIIKDYFFHIFNARMSDIFTFHKINNILTNIA